MAQARWTYLGNGRKNEIGIYHGDESGHVLIYCNQNVVAIDFNMKDSKTYSFMVGYRLLELHIKKTGDQFEYELDDKDTKMPIDEKLETQLFWKDFMTSLIIGIGIGILVFLMYQWLVH